MTVSDTIKAYNKVQSKLEAETKKLQHAIENSDGMSAYEFEKYYKLPMEKEIAKLKKELRKMEYDFDKENVKVNIGDLMDEIIKITKLKEKDLEIFINDVIYSWGKNGLQNIEKFINAGEFTPMLNICICHKMYAGYKDGSSDARRFMYYGKDIELNSSNISFKKGTLKDNVILTPNPYGFKFRNVRDMNIRMTLKNLTIESDVWTPVDTMKKAVLNCLKKTKENIDLPNIGE